MPTPRIQLVMAFSLLIFCPSRCVLPPLTAAQPSENPTRVLLVTIDGLRWQEIFGGAEEALLNRESGGVRDVELLREEFWRTSPEERREVLMPFLWSTVARQGRLVGHPDFPPLMTVTNGLFFSYPGYNELLTGAPDPRVDSNAKRPNPNVTVLEWLHRQAGFEGRVAAVSAWDVFPFIINDRRSGIPVNAGWSMPRYKGYSPRPAIVEAYRELPRVWHNVRYDWLTFESAQAAIRHLDPRVMYVALGETDDWAHEGRYDLYLQSARRIDDYIRRLWLEMNARPGARGRTTMIITTDHGRGDSLTGWKGHGKDLPGSDQIWAAALGPAVDRETEISEKLIQAQIAATVANSVGQDFTKSRENIAAPLPFVRRLATSPP